MTRLLAVAVVLSALISACASTGLSPEERIVAGASTVTAAATVGNVALKNDKITVPQAKSYDGLLRAAQGHLTTAAATLSDCRKKTGSSKATQPDPCEPGVAADITLAVTIANDVKKTLDTK